VIEYPSVVDEERIPHGTRFVVTHQDMAGSAPFIIEGCLGKCLNFETSRLFVEFSLNYKLLEEYFG
jgi:hypothetical protein